MKLQELFDKPEKWTKGVSSRDKDGYETFVQDATSVCWCLLGGLAKCYPVGDKYFTAVEKVQNAIYYFEGTESITAYNDASHRTFEDIRKVIELADV